jgi:hypothetical protein
MDAPISVATVAASRAALVVLNKNVGEWVEGYATHKHEDFMGIRSLIFYPLDPFVFFRQIGGKRIP